MARFTVEGSHPSSIDPSKNVTEYTDSLSENTLFPENSSLPMEVFLCYDNSSAAPNTTIAYFGIPSQRDQAVNRLENYRFTLWNTHSSSMPVLYNIDGLLSEAYSTIYPDRGINFKAYKDKEFRRYALPTTVTQKVFDESQSPTSAQSNTGVNGWAWGYETTQSKGVNYNFYQPVVNYNPNKIVVVPYLARYSTGVGGKTTSPTLNSLSYHDQDILMLNDILNDTIISGIGANNEYSLKFALLVETRIYYTSDYNTTGSGSNRRATGYYLCQSPISITNPNLYSYLEYRTADYDYIYPCSCRDLYLPICNNYTLIGVSDFGNASSTVNNGLVMIKSTGYSQAGEYVFGTFSVYNPTEEEFESYVVSDNASRPYVEVSDLSGANVDLYKNLLSTVAGLGQAFVTSWAALQAVKNNGGIDNNLIDQYPDSIYYPKINERGKVTGVDSGNDAKTNPLKEAGDNGTNPFDEVPVIDPDDAEDTNDYVDEIPIKTHLSVNPSNAFNTRYALSEEDLKDFEDFLWTGNQSMTSNVLDGLKMFGENPMNFFLSLKMFPFDVTPYATTHSGQLTFGNGVVVTDSSDNPIVVTKLEDANIVIDLGTVNFRKYFKNFLDYEPYTTAKLYIPFCGETQVETSVFVGHEINIKLIVDIITGSCCAAVYRDKIPCLYVNGVISTDIAITGENFQEYMKATRELINTGMGAIDSAVSLGVGVSNTQGSGTSTSRNLSNGSFSHTDSSNQSNNKITNSSKSYSAGGAIGGLVNTIFSAYEWYNTPTALQISGTSSDLCNLYKPTYAYFVIEQPVPMITGGYAETYGFATMDYGSLPPEGLVVCKNAHVQPSTATEPETTELNELLNTGVWI